MKFEKKAFRGLVKMLGILLTIACAIIAWMIFQYDHLLMGFHQMERERDAARNELEPVKFRLMAHQAMLEDAREEIEDLDNENFVLWEDLLEERDLGDECREGLAICDDYCLCPWTLQPTSPGLEEPPER